MRIMNWEGVDESSFDKLPAGGYVVEIKAVEDVPSKEYLWVVYDVAEGPQRGFYSDDFGLKNPWAHRFARSYKESAKGMFKAFLCRLEESNPGWSLARWQQRCDERELVGLKLGVLLGLEQYTNEKGEDKERLNVVAVKAAHDIRDGNFSVPEPVDNREGTKPVPKDELPPVAKPAQKPEPAANVPKPAQVSDDDLPF